MEFQQENLKISRKL